MSDRVKKSTILSSSKNKGNINDTNNTRVPSAAQRLQRELFGIMNMQNPTISAFPEGENLLKWLASIEGPVDTPYEGLKYRLSLSFPDKYPIIPPVVKFITPCFHPNVDPLGNICLDILKEEWTCSLEVRTILLSIQSLLGEPNNDSPLNSDAATLWKNQIEFKKTLIEKYDKESKNTLN